MKWRVMDEGMYLEPQLAHYNSTRPSKGKLKETLYMTGGNSDQKTQADNKFKYKVKDKTEGNK